MKRLSLLLVLALGQASAQGWQPAAGKLPTPWAGDVSPGEVWAEYPRPLLRRDRVPKAEAGWFKEINSMVMQPEQAAGIQPAPAK